MRIHSRTRWFLACLLFSSAILRAQSHDVVTQERFAVALAEKLNLISTNAENAVENAIIALSVHGIDPLDGWKRKEFLTKADGARMVLQASGKSGQIDSSKHKDPSAWRSLGETLGMEMDGVEPLLSFFNKHPPKLTLANPARPPNLEVKPATPKPWKLGEFQVRMAMKLGLIPPFILSPSEKHAHHVLNSAGIAPFASAPGFTDPSQPLNKMDTARLIITALGREEEIPEDQRMNRMAWLSLAEKIGLNLNSPEECLKALDDPAFALESANGTPRQEVKPTPAEKERLEDEPHAASP